jgi:hypothetical protein
MWDEMHMEIPNEETITKRWGGEYGINIIKRIKQHTVNGRDSKAYNTAICTAENVLSAFTDLATMYLKSTKQTLLIYDTIHYFITPCHRLPCYLLPLPTCRWLPFTRPCLSHVCYRWRKYSLKIKSLFSLSPFPSTHPALQSVRMS